jgi:hypothetical protein
VTGDFRANVRVSHRKRSGTPAQNPRNDSSTQHVAAAT